MSSTWVVLNSFIVLISYMLTGINGASSSSSGNGSSCVINVHVTYNFYLCLDNKYYECFPHNFSTSNGGSVANISGNTSTTSSSSSSSSSIGKLTFISYFNEKNLLQKAGCHQTSNHCPSGNGLVMLNCNSNISHVNSTSVAVASSNGQNCIVKQTNNANNNTNELTCSVIINANNKDYLYAFIAVIIIVLVLFCLCPICCIYQFCRHCQDHEFYQSYHGRKNRKSNCKKTSSGTTSQKTNNNNNNNNNNKIDGDVSYEDRAVLFSTAMRTTTIKNEQQMESQPINKSNCNVSRDGFSNTNPNDEIVV